MLTVDFERLDLRPGQRLLDLGCGGGRHVFAALRHGATVIALDYDLDELRGVRDVVGAMGAEGEIPADAPWGTARGNALDLPFPDDTFDRIIAAEVLEHIWEDEVALAELVRVLKPEGRIALTVPNRGPERICWALDADYHDTPGGHVRIYSRGDLDVKFQRAGLAVRDRHQVHALHAPYWWLRCAVGVRDADRSRVVRKYHDFLVWQMTDQPAWVETLDRTLNPVLGKSVAIYAEKT